MSLTANNGHLPLFPFSPQEDICPKNIWATRSTQLLGAGLPSGPRQSQALAVRDGILGTWTLVMSHSGMQVCQKAGTNDLASAVVPGALSLVQFQGMQEC